MIQKVKQKGYLFTVIFLCSLIYFIGVQEVPFHPDESTQIFMSQDIELLFSQPSLLTFNQDNPQDLRQKYRLLDPPLSRWFIGFAHMIFGVTSLPNDWDWSKTWEENYLNGALPTPFTLWISRLAVSFVFPFLLYYAYKTGETLADKTTGWLNLLLTAFNALILLHTRRAMAESLLIFFTFLSLYLLVTKIKPAWLLAFPISLAFNAKYSTAPLVLMGLIYCLKSASNSYPSFRQRLKTALLYSIIIISITFLLNPVLWTSPVDALKAAAIERQQLLAAQTAAIGEFNPAQTPQTIPDRLLALIAQVFIAPPAIADVGNYLAATEIQTQIYFSHPWHNLTNGFLRGGFFFSLSLIGLISMIQTSLREKSGFSSSKVVYLATFFLQFSGIISGIPLAFQRYYIPLLPFFITFTSYAISIAISIGRNSVKRGV